MENEKRHPPELPWKKVDDRECIKIVETYQYDALDYLLRIRLYKETEREHKIYTEPHWASEVFEKRICPFYPKPTDGSFNSLHSIYESWSYNFKTAKLSLEMWWHCHMSE